MSVKTAAPDFDALTCRNDCLGSAFELRSVNRGFGLCEPGHSAYELRRTNSDPFMIKITTPTVQTNVLGPL